MRRIIAAVVCLWSGTGLAMNGLRPIGVSAESNALGGTGVGNFYNFYDALYKNPAEMAQAPLRSGQTQAVFGMTYGDFKPSVKATYGKDQNYKEPVNDTAAVFPSALGIGYRINDKATMAFGAYGGGGGADYGQKADSVYRARSKTVSWTGTAGTSWAFDHNTSAGINFNASHVNTQASNLSRTSNKMVQTGGEADVYGTLIGLSHRVDRLTMGAIYQPAQTALIKRARDIEGTGIQNNLLFTPVPTELATGLTWREYQWMVEVDYRFLQWSEAEFLKQVGWKDQHVVALGFEYGTRNRVRVGANLSTDAVSNRSGVNGLATTRLSNKNFVNVAADAFATTSGLGVNNYHYTLGSSHGFGPKQDLRLNTALVYMQPGSLERSGYYDSGAGAQQYGWKSHFGGSLVQVDLTYLW